MVQSKVSEQGGASMENEDLPLIFPAKKGFSNAVFNKSPFVQFESMFVLLFQSLIIENSLESG